MSTGDARFSTTVLLKKIVVDTIMRLMEPRFLSDTKVVTCSYNVPPPGAYALQADVVEFWKCREQFATRFLESHTGFFFSHKPNQGLSIASFLQKIECILDLAEPSVYARCNEPNVLWIEHSKFWSNCIMRRSVLTVFVRCGLLYDPAKNNMDDALFGECWDGSLWSQIGSPNDYARQTRPALMRFLYGFTSYKTDPNSRNGWRDNFQNNDEQVIRNRLVSSDPNYVPLYLSLGHLWG
jgi:hypothetical protein